MTKIFKYSLFISLICVQVHAENYNQEFATILLESKSKIPQLETFLSIREKKIITVGGTKLYVDWNTIKCVWLD